MNRIHAVSADSIWAAGSNLVHFDGDEWRSADRRDVEGELWSVDVLPNGYGWAVGDNEEVIPIRDGVAGPSERVLGYRFHDVAVVSPTDVWAIARSAQSSAVMILRLRDGQWLPDWTPPNAFVDLGSIWMQSATEGWAVGTTAVHYDGHVWTEWPLPNGLGAGRVRETAANDVWAIGGDGPNFGFEDDHRWILHFDGTGWSIVLNEVGAKLESLTVRGDKGFALTQGGDVFALQQGVWRPLSVKVPAVAQRYPNLWMPYIIDVDFVPGESYAVAANNDGWIYRLDAESVVLLHDAGTLGAVAMLNDHAGWALGRRAMAYDGTEWRAMPDDSVLHQARDIAAVGAREAWAVGPGGFVARYASGAWAQTPFPTSIDLIRVATADDGRVWALAIATPGVGRKNVGAEAALFERDAGNVWREVWRGPGVAHDVAIGHGDVLIATSVGVWRGGTDGDGGWTQIRDEGAQSAGIGPAGERWAGGDGRIDRFDGSAWTFDAYLPAGASVHAIRTSGDFALAACDYGIVMAFVNGKWKLVRGDPEISGSSGQSFGLHDIDAAPLANGRMGVWTVGEPDTILFAPADDVLSVPPITPMPTEDHFWDIPWPVPRAYLPIALAHPPYRDTTCRDANSLPAPDIQHTAVDTARFYAAGGPAPEPTLKDLVLMTAAQIQSRFGVELAGVAIGDRTVTSSTCLWWGTFSGWFDPKS
ncbi:MAG: hypothetical protein ABI780_13190, partial [Ardenticatenales bacterium]